MSTPATSAEHAPSPGLRTAYTPQDHDQVKAINKWLHDHAQSRAWLSKKTKIPNGTLSQILSGKYISSPTKQLNAMSSVLRTEEERDKDGTPGYVATSVHKLMVVVCDRTRKHANFGAFTGHVGIGKTSACKQYALTVPMTVLVEANPNMTPGVLMDELLTLLNVPRPAGLDKKFREIVRVLSGTNYLLIADEAERLSSSALEYLRRIRDKAGVGVVLVGTEKLTELVKREHGQFDQIRSRISMWPKTVKTVSRDDADELVRAGLEDALRAADMSTEIDDEVLEALWAYSAGSARVLMEALIPALKDYGLGKLPLTAGLVDKVAEKVLFMPPRAKPGKDGKGGAA